MALFLRVCFLLAVLAQATVSQDSNVNDESSWDTCECNDGPCSCVVYYLCGVDGKIITTGDTILDPRLGVNKKVKQCSGIEICCKQPPPDNNPPEDVSQRVEPNQPGPTPKPAPDRVGCGLRDTAFNLDQTWARVNIDDGTTAFAEFPWMLALLRKDGRANVFLCGASLIHYKVALTAAHCVQKLSAGDLVVRAGEWNTVSTDEPIAHQDRSVARISLHPRYTKGSLFNDMAILQLESPFREAINVGVVCLPDTGAKFVGQRCVASGWGKDSFGVEGSLQTTLRKVDLPIVGSSACQDQLRTTRLGLFFRLDSSFICAGGEPAKDTCKGDGGGPLMCQSERDPMRYVQVGIVSWGIGCKDSKVPAVYTNVAGLREWIDSEIRAMGLQNLAIHP